MIAGKGTPDQAPARLTAYRDPAFMQKLIDKLVMASTAYLIRQIDAGAEAVQIFESFGSALPPALFDRLSLEPIRRMVDGLKAARPHAKVIVFVRGGGANLHRFAAAGIGDGLALDWTLDPARVLPTLPQRDRHPGQSRSAGARSPAAPRWMTASITFWPRCADARTSSIWGTASCPRPRPNTWRS